MATTQGTAVTWRDSGGTEIMTLASLADDGGRAGELHDFGAEGFPTRARMEFECVFTTAPTAGERVDIFWASSSDGTNFDAEVTGSDSSFTEADNVRLKLIGSLIVTNDTSTQRDSWIFYLPARYGVPVVVNKGGYAFSSTASNNKLNVVPLTDS